jgi:hypothetical protein
MPKRSSKIPSSDPIVAAFEVVEKLTGGTRSPRKPRPAQKNAAAVSLGRLGGLKGGKARAAKLSPEQRSEIARRAAAARWSELHAK